MKKTRFIWTKKIGSQFQGKKIAITALFFARILISIPPKVYRSNYHWEKTRSRQSHSKGSHNDRMKVQYFRVHVQRRKGSGGDDDRLKPVEYGFHGNRRIQASEMQHRIRNCWRSVVKRLHDYRESCRIR